MILWLRLFTNNVTLKMNLSQTIDLNFILLLLVSKMFIQVTVKNDKGRQDTKNPNPLLFFPLHSINHSAAQNINRPLPPPRHESLRKTNEHASHTLSMEIAFRIRAISSCDSREIKATWRRAIFASERDSEARLETPKIRNQKRKW